MLESIIGRVIPKTILLKLGQVHMSIVALFVMLLQQISLGSCQKDTIHWRRIVNSVHLSLCWYSLQHANANCDTLSCT